MTTRRFWIDHRRRRRTSFYFVFIFDTYLKSIYICV